MQVSIYRYNPETDSKPVMQDMEVAVPEGKDLMVLDVLELARQQDPGITFRRSCREGVCGSDGININGRNALACVTPLSAAVKLGKQGNKQASKATIASSSTTEVATNSTTKATKGKLVLRPLPGLPVIRDLVVDMTQFYKQYEKVKPYLMNDKPPPAAERLQSPAQREKLDGLYECILCACCTTNCPSFWWNPDKFIGPAGLLQAYRFLADSRDSASEQRLADLDDPFSLFRCRGIMNCTAVCPKGLNPTKAIGNIRSMLLKRGT